MIGWRVSLCLCGGLRALVGLLLIGCLLGIRMPRAKSAAIGAAGACALRAILVQGPFAFWEPALEAALIAACARFGEDADFRKSLSIGVLFEMIADFWVFLASAAFGLVLGLPQMPERGSLAALAPLGFVHGALAAAGVFLLRKRTAAREPVHRAASILAVAGFIATVTLSEQTALAIPEDTLTTWLMLSIVLLMAVMAYGMGRQIESQREVARLKADQAELLERNYKALSEAYAVNAKLFHDFHNHIGVLRQMLLSQRDDKALAYLDELQAPIREKTDTVWTGEGTVDYLINSKAAAAALKGIELRAEVEFPRNTNIRGADLCAILGNLLDNAIEAVSALGEGREKVIRLTIRRINQMAVIKVVNPFEGRLAEGEGGLATTKREKGLHGWGLKSAQDAAEKYDGTVRVTVESGEFCAVATLCFHGVRA